MQPSYYPKLSLEKIDNKYVLIIWVPAGANRPYKIPDDVLANHKTTNYRIRFRSSSIIPNKEQETELGDGEEVAVASERTLARRESDHMAADVLLGLTSVGSGPSSL